MLSVKTTALLCTFSLQYLNFYDFLALFCAIGLHTLIDSQVSGMICPAMLNYLLIYHKYFLLCHI